MARYLLAFTPVGFPLTTLIRLYELLKNNSKLSFANQNHPQ